MKERIEAVQKVFWRLLVVAVVVVVIGVPLRDDGATMEALKELTTFADAFDKAQLEATLLSHARVQGVVPLGEVVAAVDSRGGPSLRAAPGAPPIDPRAAVELGTLAEVNALSGPRAELAIASVDVASLARSLGWRLSRKPSDAGYVLKSVQLAAGSSDAAADELEGQVVAARAALAEKAASLAQAEAEHEKAVELHEARKKWKAPWKSIVRANDARIEAQKKMDDLRAEWTTARDRYQELATKAERFKPGPAGAGDHGAAVATLSTESGEFELTLPVKLRLRGVQVPGLLGADFPVVRERGLWDELKGDSPERAIERLSKRFSWHYAHVTVGGFKVGGMTLLQLAPLPLLFLLWSIRKRSRGVGDSYNPFLLTAGEGLPRVGLGAKSLNVLALIVLPLLGCVLCAWSLAQIDQFPVVPVLSAAGTTVLGSLCLLELNELGDLRDAVTRSHSIPPPAALTRKR